LGAESRAGVSILQTGLHGTYRKVTCQKRDRGGSKGNDISIGTNRKAIATGQAKKMKVTNPESTTTTVAAKAQDSFSHCCDICSCKSSAKACRPKKSAACNTASMGRPGGRYTRPLRMYLKKARADEKVSASSWQQEAVVTLGAAPGGEEDSLISALRVMRGHTLVSTRRCMDLGQRSSCPQHPARQTPRLLLHRPPAPNRPCRIWESSGKSSAAQSLFSHSQARDRVAGKRPPLDY